MHRFPYTCTARALTERKPPLTPKIQPNLIRDSNLDFRINPDPNVCWICLKMLQMHYLVGVSHFAKYGPNRQLTVSEMLINIFKTLFRNGEENEKVIRNSHADLDHYQKLITSRGSSLAHACQVWSASVSVFVSNPVYRMTDRTIT